MIIKDSNKEQFYSFNEKGFSFKKIKEEGKYSGHLFIIGGNKYVLFKDGDKYILKSNLFTIDVERFSFEYRESAVFSYIIIENGSETFEIRQFKSIWEILKISTYDYLDKIDDNKLFFLFDKIKDLKTNNASDTTDNS